MNDDNMGHPCQNTRYLAYLDTMGVGTSVDLATSLNSRSLQEGYNLHTVCASRVDVRIFFGSYNEKGKQVGGNCPLAMDLIMNVVVGGGIGVALPSLQFTPPSPSLSFLSALVGCACGKSGAAGRRRALTVFDTGLVWCGRLQTPYGQLGSPNPRLPRQALKLKQATRLTQELRC